MGVALGWVAFALVGVGAAPHAERDQKQLTYTVRMVEADGVGWREAVFSRLKPVTRQGSATVWTVSRDTMTKLVENLAKCSSTKIFQAPKVTAFTGVPATIQCRRLNRPLFTQVAWDGADAVSEVMPEKVRVGWHTTMIGRKLDQGILVQVVFEDTLINAVHHVSVSRPVDQTCPVSFSPAGPASQVFSDAGRAAGLCGYAAVSMAEASKGNPAQAQQCPDSEMCCESKECDGKEDGNARTVVVDVPEIDTQEVVGEWLIPRGEVLLVSFGAHTMADKDGKAVVKERLAMIEAVDTAEPTRVAVLPGALPYVNARVPSVSVPLPKAAMPTPNMPSRSIPQGVHADGSPADLPPLPSDEMHSDSSETESSEPMPSPQTKKAPQPKPANDSGANKAEFSLPKAAATFLPSFFMPSAPGGFQFLLPVKPLSIKLPFGQKLEVEIFGKIVPETDVN
jgi:hypothetical protein